MKRSSTEKTKLSKVNIIEVYDDNFISEIKRIGNYLEEYNYIGMDTEFPGIVYGLNQFTTDFYYKSLKTNVDSLKLIQLGITLCNSKGEYPDNCSTWQFNFKFDCKIDKCNPNSFSVLVSSGIDFEKLKSKGIEHKIFAEYFTISGLVLNPDVHWISFHGSSDFAYMLRLLLNCDLPETEMQFTRELIEFFPSHYDIRILVQGKENLKGGLNRLASSLEVLRVGKTHQAGSDSVVTADVFFKLIENNIVDSESLENDRNILYGLGDGADYYETFGYTKFNTGVANVNGYSGIVQGANGQNKGNNMQMNLMYNPYVGTGQFNYGGYSNVKGQMMQNQNGGNGNVIMQGGYNN